MLLFVTLLLHAFSGFVSSCDYGYPTPIGNLFESAEKYKGNKYYLSKFYYSNVDQAESVCLSYGMYLVEINDAGEYKFVQDIARQAKTSGLLISGTDKAQEGTWIFQFSKEPVKFFDWYGPNPDNYGGGEDYLSLNSAFQMNDFSYLQPGSYKFLCEKSG
ncbi:collectin-12-like [Physella acuta]|uniref:collectin-12-like n=1 Tax=Physella acuta TaxID=109671 RepID=UPI0027DC4B5B|nr:collectin-12-like [Physella acuta]